jgi:hypothetical protein
MGYDMSIRAYAGPDSVSTRQNGDCADYFRLNIWGMGTMRGIMERAGVLSYESHPSFPDYPGHEHFDADDAPKDAVGGAYREACTAVIESVASDGRVPAYKFGSNDGWLVNPDECRVIAKGLRDLVECDEVHGDEDDGSWKWSEEALDFADFCERAAEHGEGFEVW